MGEHGDVWRSPCGGVELRCGDWQTVLADVERVDAVITDPPYSERTHKGHDSGMADANRATASDARRLRTDKRTGAVYAVGAHRRRAIAYDHWTSEDVAAFVARWGAAASGWMVCQTSHDLLPEYAQAMEAAGRYVFAPVPAVIPGMTVRMGGDGPSSWAVYNVVSRTKSREMQRWGTLPGAYTGARGEHGGSMAVAGGKPLALMRAIVRDYSRPGDLICDPCAGGATTLLAAAMEGRRAIGAELDPETFSKAVKRLERGWTTSLLTGLEAPRAEQMALGGTDGE